MFDPKPKAQLASGAGFQSSTEGLSWLSFPTHDRLLATGDLSVLERIEVTCRHLEAISKNGTAADRMRAGAAQTACRLTLDLLRTIQEAQKDLTRK
jgi:hypothetical protein